jgi:hypothetical protein
VAHAQFETIHPFIDGNGRTGRMIMHAILRDRNLTTESTIPISAGIMSNTDDYFSALTRYRSGDTDTIISMTARSIVHGVGLGRQLVGDLQSIRTSWDDLIKACKRADAWRLADLLISQSCRGSSSIIALASARTMSIASFSLSKTLAYWSRLDHSVVGVERGALRRCCPCSMRLVSDSDVEL